MNDIAWKKSTRSGNGADCVEVAILPDRVMVRDSKHPDGPHLSVAPHDWRTFLTALTPDPARK